MAATPNLFLRGNIWTWRRRVPEFSTKTRHWQLSLRTSDRPTARILANRLTYESDRMFDEISRGELTPAQGKAWLETVIGSELSRIERQRMISRLDPVGESEDDRRHDWATMHAWRLLAKRGLAPKLNAHEKAEILQLGASERDLDTLEFTLDILARDVASEPATNRMAGDARRSIANVSDQAKLGQPSAMTILQLRQLLLAGKAAAWEAAEEMTDPSLAQARDIAFALVQGATHPVAGATGAFSGTPLTASPSDLNTNTPTVAETDRSREQAKGNKFIYDPNLLKLVERINDEKDRAHIKMDTRKQLVAQARLFIAATGVDCVTEINQGHLKFYKTVLQKLPKSYGKSPKDAERNIDEILARADKLAQDKVGLSPRTINGHLERFSLIFRTARSESLKISEDIQLDLLRVPETKRARDKREGFSYEQLINLFEHPIWTGCSNHKRRHIPGDIIIKDGLYWGPLLAGYSGARREEVLALTPSDIVTVDGIPCYHIRNNEHRGLKTLSSERTIPLHPHLLELGFLDHVKKMRERRETAIFPELLAANQSESFGDKMFYNWDKALAIRFDGNPRKLCFHSFRHYVISRLKRETTVTEKERRDLAGHIGKDAHDEEYEEATSMGNMKHVVELLPRVF